MEEPRVVSANSTFTEASNNVTPEAAILLLYVRVRSLSF